MLEEQYILSLCTGEEQVDNLLFQLAWREFSEFDKVNVAPECLTDADGLHTRPGQNIE